MTMLSSRLKYILDQIFCNRYASRGPVLGNGPDGHSITFNSKNFNSVSFRFPCKPDNNTLDVPVIFMSDSDIESMPMYTHYVAPLTVGQSVSCKTGDAMLKTLFNTYGYTLKKAIAPNGSIYYGTAGLILDSDFNPVVIGMRRIWWDNDGRCYTMRNILMVSPKVFDREDILERAVINKVIPYYSSERGMDGNTVQVIIDNMNGFIIRSRCPEGTDQSVFRKILSEYKDEVLP